MAPGRHFSDALPTCPFCTFTAPSNSERDVYMLLQHVELSHNDQESPFRTRDPSSGPSNQRSSSRMRSRSRSASGRQYQDLTPSPEEDVYVDCPLQCGEAIHMTELDGHLELHEIEGLGLEELDSSPGPPYGSRHASPRPGSSRARTPSHDMGTDTHLSGGFLHPSDTKVGSKQLKHSVGLSSLKDLVLGPASKKNRSIESEKRPGAIKRLGKAELGPHAFEDKMPSWLYKQLSQGPSIQISNAIARNGSIIRIERIENETPDIIPVLAQLIAQDPGVSKAFLCHPTVKHIFKTPKEGGFCGYRNIQMMISFMQGTNFPGHEHFPGRTPSIIVLQDMIEKAWDIGFNPTGRIETGGIKGTRKYIGTPEAQALFCSLDIPCEANAFNKSRTAPSGSEIHHQVFQAALEYFSTGVTGDPTAKVYQTGLAPIYFQHPGHSLTICGLEIRKSGRMNLVCLDPMFKTGVGVAKLIGTKVNTVHHPEKLLKAYRRGDDYLKKYQSFEIMKLMAPLRDLPDGSLDTLRSRSSPLPHNHRQLSR